jgi:hypothetical protein
MAGGRYAMLALSCFAVRAELRGQQLKPETERDFNCYVHSAEARMQSRPRFLLADSDSTLQKQVVLDRRIQTNPANGANPHQATAGLIHDWVGTVFIPGASLDRTIRMLQDYGHRAQYFRDILAASRPLCRTGQNHFRVYMRLKEPAVIDTENDVVWDPVDQHHWQTRSYSTNVREEGKDHKYLLRLYSYWRFSEAPQGVYVEGETITLSGPFGSAMRTFGSILGISPEKSLKQTLAIIRETVSNPSLEFASPPADLPECGEFSPSIGCASH